MNKEQALKYISSQGYTALVDEHQVIMVQIEAKKQQTAQKEFNELRESIRKAGYRGSIGYKFCEVE